MRKSLFFILFLFSLLPSYLFSQNGTTIYDSIVSGGLQRKFRLYVPNSYSPGTPAPLIFNLHGYTSNSAQQMPYANFMPIADTAKFLVVHPDGTVFNGAQYWNAGFGGAANDVQFISQLIDSIKASYNIDLNAVYSCGMSNGGIMSYYLACNLPNRITAIASVTGSMLNVWSTCVPSLPRPFPVMEIHGTSDGTVLYNGDNTFASIDSVIKKWRIYNNCNSIPTTFTISDIVTSDNSTAVNYRYTGGTNGSSVELFKVNNGSHSWPGALPVIANTNQDFNASVEIWRFFRQYKLNQFIANVGFQEQKSQNEITVYPNPSSSFLNVQLKNGDPVLSIVISDLHGKIVLQNTSANSIPVSALENGLYFIHVKAKTLEVHQKFIKN